jgi:hypothetical protein
MKATNYLMDQLNEDFYINMVDYVYDETGLDLPDGMAMVMMGGEL